MNRFFRLLTAVALAAGLSHAISAVEAHGSLKVTGSNLCDSTGKPVTLRGMSLYWSMHPTGYQYWTEGVVKWLQSDWNVTVVRAAMGVETDEGSGNKGWIDDPKTQYERLDKVMQAAVEAGIYVVVDWHAHMMHTDSAKIFFDSMARKWGNTPNVIWEIWNEPNMDLELGPVYTWAEIAQYAAQVIPVIRKYSKNPIIVGTPIYSSTPHQVGTELHAFTNILYTLHFYATTHTFRNVIGEAMGQGHAVFASEWGTTLASGSGTVNLTSSQLWLDTMDARGVSSCNWSIADAVETSAALVPKASPAGGWDTTMLKLSGQFVRRYFRAKNLFNGARYTGPDTTTLMTLPLTPSRNMVLANGSDTVVFKARYSKMVTSWQLTLTGQTSGAVFTASGASTDSVSVKWAATMKKAFTTKTFQNGEIVQAVLTPVSGSGAAACLATVGIGVTSVGPRAIPVSASWGSTLTVPGATLAGTSRWVVVRLIGMDGRVMSTHSAAAENVPGGISVLLARPRQSTLALLEIESGDKVYRAKLAPTF